jgi:hypothetical protein
MRSKNRPLLFVTEVLGATPEPLRLVAPLGIAERLPLLCLSSLPPQNGTGGRPPRGLILLMTDAVDKVGDEQRAGNSNRGAEFFESMLRARLRS